MKSVSIIAFDDRKATIKEYIAEYERTYIQVRRHPWRRLRNQSTNLCKKWKGQNWDSLPRTRWRISRAKMTPMMTRCANSPNMCLDFLPQFYSNTVENINSKDGTYDDTMRSSSNTVCASTPKQSNGTKDDPVVLRAETLDKSKQYRYCPGCQRIERHRAYQWWVLDVQEGEKNEKAKTNKAKTKKAKADEFTDGEERKEWFQYSTGTSPINSVSWKTRRKSPWQWTPTIPTYPGACQWTFWGGKGSLGVLYNVRIFPQLNMHMSAHTEGHQQKKIGASSWGIVGHRSIGVSWCLLVSSGLAVFLLGANLQNTQTPRDTLRICPDYIGLTRFPMFTFWPFFRDDIFIYDIFSIYLYLL